MENKTFKELYYSLQMYPER